MIPVMAVLLSYARPGRAVRLPARLAARWLSSTRSVLATCLVSPADPAPPRPFLSPRAATSTGRSGGAADLLRLGLCGGVRDAGAQGPRSVPGTSRIATVIPGAVLHAILAEAPAMPLGPPDLGTARVLPSGTIHRTLFVRR